MTDRQDIFERINELAQNIDEGFEFTNEEQLEEFLDDVDNQQYKEYDEIERLYNELMELSFYDDEDDQ
jgi:cell division septum initiation protein DivIVA